MISGTTACVIQSTPDRPEAALLALLLANSIAHRLDCCFRKDRLFWYSARTYGPYRLPMLTKGFKYRGLVSL